MDDLISRQAAIDAICTEGTRLERNGTVAMAEIKQWCVDILEALPSAQPELSEIKRDLSDLISRQDAINIVAPYDEGREMRDALEDLPSAQPEPCEDAVSRNAIIQKLNTMDRYVSEELILCDTDKKFPKNEVFIVDDVYEEIVENLPSAQPGLPDLPEWAKKVEYHDPFGNPIYVYVRVNDKTVTIKADDLQKALDYVTEHGEEVTIEGRRTDEPDR